MDWHDKFHFRNYRLVKNSYYVKFPSIFQNEGRRDHSIYAFLEYPNKFFDNNYFTVIEFMEIVNALWDISDSTYYNYYDDVNESLQKLRSGELGTREHMERASNVIARSLTEKGICKDIKAITTRWEEHWSELTEKSLINTVKKNLYGEAIGFRIVFSQKSFSCIVVF